MGRSIPTDAEKRDAFVLETFAQAEAVFQRLAADPKRGGVLVQPYMPGVETDEYWLTFLGGSCTHAVRKPPLFKGDGSTRRRAVDLPDLQPRLLAFAEQMLGWMRNHNQPAAIVAQLPEADPIDQGRPFVEHDNRRVFQQGASDADPLLLAAR
jgi:hypothetical protein